MQVGKDFGEKNVLGSLRIVGQLFLSVTGSNKGVSIVSSTGKRMGEVPWLKRVQLQGFCVNIWNSMPQSVEEACPRGISGAI